MCLSQCYAKVSIIFVSAIGRENFFHTKTHFFSRHRIKRSFSALCEAKKILGSESKKVPKTDFLQYRDSKTAFFIGSIFGAKYSLKCSLFSAVANVLVNILQEYPNLPLYFAFKQLFSLWCIFITLRLKYRNREKIKLYTERGGDKKHYTHPPLCATL